MNRSNFFKSLITLIVSPSVIGDIDWEKPKKKLIFGKAKKNNKQLISELQLLTPIYYKQMVDKYGDANYTKFLNGLQNI